MLKEQEALIEKTLETSDFLSGGLLNPRQQDQFITLVRRYSTLLPQVRFHRMGQPVEEIDKMHVGEPVTESASENSAPTVFSKPDFNKVTLTAVKLRSQWNITTESLQGNIEQNRLEDTIMNAFTERMATDFEYLALMGDITTYAGGTDPTSRLLKRLNGWYLQAQSSHVLDAAGASISKNLLAKAKRMLPKEYRNDPGMRWIMSDTLVVDWEDYVSERETNLGDRVLGGGSAGNPIGTPILPVPLIPDTMSVTTGAVASPAYVIGIQQGPFVITSSNNALLIDIDNAGATAITLPTGTFEAVILTHVINTALGANIAYDDGTGRIVLQSTTTGVASEVDIQAGNANLTLGFTVAVVAGAAAPGTIGEGSFIMLCNPKNLIFGMLDSTRIFSEFEKNYDRIETIMYNHLDAKIENLDAMVLIDNVRLRAL